MSIQPPRFRRDAAAALSEPLRAYQSDSARLRHLFSSEDAHGATLLLAASKLIGYEALVDFLPETIRLELQDELKLSSINDEAFSKLMAAVAIATTDRFYKDLPGFIEICNVLGGSPPDPELFDPADVYEMAWAIIEAEIIDGFDGERGEDMFSEEIRVYMGETLKLEGFFTPPALLRMAIMLDVHNPAESFAESEEILPSVIESDISRHEELVSTMTLQMSDLVKQLALVDPKIESSLKSLAGAAQR